MDEDVRMFPFNHKATGESQEDVSMTGELSPALTVY